MFLFPFLVVLFLIIVVSFRTFDEGMLAQATRISARQGSLYWVDPLNYSPYQPRLNPRIKESMIRSPIDYYRNILINPGDEVVTPTVEVTGAIDSGGSSPNRIWRGVGDANVNVEVTYNHQSLGFGWWLGITGNDMSIHTSSELSTEARY